MPENELYLAVAQVVEGANFETGTNASGGQLHGAGRLNQKCILRWPMPI